MGLIPIESRHCTYITPDSTTYTFFCSAYEYCCGNTCCRPPVFKFYSFWYFWLTVILILLLCSGGSWWYRFRYRQQFLMAGTAHFVPPPPHGQDYRHTAGVFYYPSSDRVYLSGPPKDPNLYPPYMGGIPAPPAYSAVNPTGELSYHQENGPPPFGAIPGQPPPPGFRCLPPSYDSIMANSATYPQQPLGIAGATTTQPNVLSPAPGSSAVTQHPFPPSDQS